MQLAWLLVMDLVLLLVWAVIVVVASNVVLPFVSSCERLCSSSSLCDIVCVRAIVGTGLKCNGILS